MRDDNLGPPEKKERPGGYQAARPDHNAINRTAEATTTEAASTSDGTAARRQCSAGQAWRRRRQASYRLVPLDCGCRDPWPCRCTVPPLSERMVDAGREAALHLLERGQVPLLELEVLRALYRRGGDDRRLAVELHALTGGVAA